ncbi:hypothetical protein JW948_11980 [bacterium]|nr:hypothetical protein [bacterium]
MKKTVFLIIFFIITMMALWTVRGNRIMKNRSETDCQQILAGIDTARIAVSPEALKPLPAPVRRYLQQVLGNNASRYSLVRLRHGGYMHVGMDSNFYDHPKWKFFVAEDLVRLDRPAFFWKAMIHLGWEFWRKGSLLLDADRAELVWTWMGVVPLLKLSNPHVRKHALAQYLVFSPWYPTALLQSDYLSWTAVNDTSAHVTIQSNGLTIQGEFHFNGDGMLCRFVTNDIGRITEGGAVYEACRVNYRYYEKLEGILMPVRLSYSWKTPRGWISNADFRLDEIVFE